MAENIEYILKQEKFIHQFDSFVPKNAAEEQIKKVVDDYKRSLDKLTANKDAIFSLLHVDEGAISKTKKVENENYPKEIKNLHRGIAGAMGAAILAGAYIGLSLWLGGGNTEAWSSTLQLITIGTSLLPAVPATIVSAKLFKKHYKNEDVLKKKISLEKLVLNIKAKQIEKKAVKEAEIARLAINIKSDFENIINGKTKIKDKNISSLTRGKRRKLKKLLKDIAENKTKIDESFETLKDMKIAVKERKINKQTTETKRKKKTTPAVDTPVREKRKKQDTTPVVSKDNKEKKRRASNCKQ